MKIGNQYRLKLGVRDAGQVVTLVKIFPFNPRLPERYRERIDRLERLVAEMAVMLWRREFARGLDGSSDLRQELNRVATSLGYRPEFPAGTESAAKYGTSQMTEEQIKHMVDRFLGWKLPENFNPDYGISYTRPNYPPSLGGPSGTNLFDANQAEAMVRFMVEGL
jgi:hypothetical protein